MEKITDNRRSATKKYSADYKISNDFVKKYRESNFDVVMEKDHQSEEFKKMIDSMKKNMEFYVAYKKDKLKKDKRLLDALRSGDDEFIEDLIKDDDLPLNTEELKFLNELENDIDEASHIQSNLERIENETCLYKKKNLLLYLNDRDEENENYKKYLEFKEHEKLFFQYLEIMDKTPFNNYETKEDVKERKHNYRIIVDEAKYLWTKAFDLFYTFSFVKLYKYFNNLVFSIQLVMEFKKLIERNEWAPSNEELILPEEEYDIEELEDYEDEYREEIYVDYIKIQSYKLFKSLMFEYKKKRYLKPNEHFDEVKNTSQEKIPFDIKKEYLEKLLAIAHDKSFAENLDVFSSKEIDKYNKLESAAAKEDYLSLRLQLKIYDVVKKLEEMEDQLTIFNNTPGNIIDVKGLNKIYKSKEFNLHVLKNLELTIAKGDFVILLGSSGSGKTTLMNMLSGIDTITYGDVVVNNVNIRNLTNEELTKFRKENIGYVFQRYGLIPNLTVAENIRMGAYLSNQKKLASSWKPLVISDKELDNILKQVDLEGMGSKYPHELSGGQQQRVAIARVIAKKPSIIFADEPTSALDEDSSKRVNKLLQFLNKEYKMTIVMITHDEKNVEFANRLIYLKDGQVVNDVIKKGN